MGTQNSFKTIQRQSLREQVYHQLKTAIIRLDLEPGQKVKDQELAEKFQVSRTPVREALRRLEDEGLVVTSPGSFTRVAEIHEEEVKQATLVVATLHALAAREACYYLREQDLLELRQINHRLEFSLRENDLISAVECDDQFHNVFLEQSRNDEIIRALEPVEPKIRRLEFAKFNSVEGIYSVSDHELIIEASNHQNLNKVSDLVKQNWMSLFELLTQK
ncbi:GntR family transcriptional regulator [Alkalibacillus silvisoli]